MVPSLSERQREINLQIISKQEEGVRSENVIEIPNDGKNY